MSDIPEPLTSSQLADELRKSIDKALKDGKTVGIAKSIRELRQLEKETEVERCQQETAETDPEAGIPDRLKVKRKYNLTPAAIKARQENAQHSTGPTTEAGKRRSKRNAFKHGSYAATRILGFGKPCKSSCPQFPCDLVEDGRCAPGGDCLDKDHLVDACLAIERALVDQDQAGLNELVVFELAETLQIIRELRRAILEDGAVVKSERFDGDGKVLGYELKPHPALLALPKLMKDFGLSLTDFMVTPAAIDRKKESENAAQTLADIFGGVSKAMQQKG